MSWLSLGLPSTVHSAWISGSNEVLSHRVGRSLCIHRQACCIALSRSMRWQLKTYSTRKCKMSTLFSGHYLRNRSTLDIGVLGYIGIVQHKKHSPEVVTLTRGTSCIYIYIYLGRRTDRHDEASDSHCHAQSVSSNLSLRSVSVTIVTSVTALAIRPCYNPHYGYSISKVATVLFAPRLTLFQSPEYNKPFFNHRLVYLTSTVLEYNKLSSHRICLAASQLKQDKSTPTHEQSIL